ncbi:Type 1 glutamine amidotransferase-like domain-containing protein [Candidatus Roizmanbacteria bacterium]|nr:Type 1 glutamine amidotransferase-like domain-containing protein [Candidatus Roizmanbacteria bacterium]
MTTYILHGGRTKIDSASNKLFFKQFTDTVQKNHVKILLCYWARDRKKWNELFEADKAKILQEATKKVDINIISAFENLPSQLKEADVIYFSGGEEEFLRQYMSNLQFLKGALENKVFIGSSMGAFLASKHYVLSLSSQNENTVYGGLGLAPYNILCHWNVETNKERKIAMLKEKDPQTPLLLIEEEKFEVFKI